MVPRLGKGGGGGVEERPSKVSEVSVEKRRAAAFHFVMSQGDFKA